MKVILAIAALGLCTLSPGVGACEYDDATSASATPQTQVGVAPAASKNQAAANVVKASAQKTSPKQQVTKGKTNDKIAAASPQ